MTSVERIVAAANRGRVDLLPVAPYMGNHAARVAGVRLRDYCTDPECLARAQTTAWEVYGQDVLVAQSDNYYMAEAYGCEIRYHDDSTPTLQRPALADISEVGRLVPPDPATGGRMPVYIEAIRILHAFFQDQVAIRGCGSGPFVMAGHLLGLEKLLLLLADIENGDREGGKQLDALMSMACETLIAFSRLQLEAGARIVQCGDSLASIDVISPSMYRRFVMPYEERYFTAIRPLCRRHHALSLLHICGNNERVFADYARVGADIVAVDHKADMGRAKREMGDRVCLIGNIDPAAVLRFGSPADVEAAARRCIALAAPGGGFILGTGCEVAPDTPVENVKALIRVAREYSTEESP